MYHGYFPHFQFFFFLFFCVFDLSIDARSIRRQAAPIYFHGQQHAFQVIVRIMSTFITQLPNYYYCQKFFPYLS